MIKYVASDLDGTLLRNGAQSLSTEIFDLIRKLIDAMHLPLCYNLSRCRI